MNELSILLVEDNDIDVLFFQRTLADSADAITVTQSGEEALEYLRTVGHERLPHLVFIDINLPGINGLEFLGHVRSDPSMASVVAFVLTTSDERSDIDAAYKKLAAGYIVKSKDACSKITTLVDWYRHSNCFTR